jgi:hypothetical protein
MVRLVQNSHMSTYAVRSSMGDGQPADSGCVDVECLTRCDVFSQATNEATNSYLLQV